MTHPFVIKYSWNATDTPWHLSKFNETLSERDSLSLISTYIHLVRSFYEMLAAKNHSKHVEAYAHYRIVDSGGYPEMVASPTQLLADYNLFCEDVSAIAHEIKT